MKKKILLKAAIDGVVQAFCLYGLLLFVPIMSIELCLFICAFVALLMSFAYLLYLTNETSNKSIVRFSLWSICAFVLCLAMLFAIQITFSIGFYPTNELVNADGLLILITLAAYILLTTLLRFCVFCVLLIKTHKKA